MEYIPECTPGIGIDSMLSIPWVVHDVYIPMHGPMMGTRVLTGIAIHVLKSMGPWSMGVGIGTPMESMLATIAWQSMHA